MSEGGHNRAESSLDKHRVYYSSRGIPLVYHGQPCDHAVLTVENYLKWYTYYLVMPNGTVEDLDTGGRAKILERFEHEVEASLPSGEGLYGDHIMHPKFMWAVASKLDYYLCLESYEMVIGRWEHIPRQPNHEYVYFRRVLDAAKQAVQWWAASTPIKDTDSAEERLLKACI